MAIADAAPRGRKTIHQGTAVYGCLYTDWLIGKQPNFPRTVESQIVGWVKIAQANFSVEHIERYGAVAQKGIDCQCMFVPVGAYISVLPAM